MFPLFQEQARYEASLGTDKLLWTCVCNMQFFTDRTMVRSVLLYNGDINRGLLAKFLGPYRPAYCRSLN